MKLYRYSELKEKAKETAMQGIKNQFPDKTLPEYVLPFTIKEYIERFWFLNDGIVVLKETR